MEPLLIERLHDNAWYCTVVGVNVKESEDEKQQPCQTEKENDGHRVLDLQQEKEVSHNLCQRVW